MRSYASRHLTCRLFSTDTRPLKTDMWSDTIHTDWVLLGCRLQERDAIADHLKCAWKVFTDSFNASQTFSVPAFRCSQELSSADWISASLFSPSSRLARRATSCS